MFTASLKAQAIAAVMALGAVASANALTLTAGNYKISLDNYDSGTINYGSTPGVKCATVAACDAVPGITKAPGSVGSVNTSADTMGIFSVSTITNILTGNIEYIKGTASSINGQAFGPYLTGVFGNLQDHFVEVASLGGATFTAIKSVGGSFSLFSNAADYNPVLGPLVGAGKDLNALMYPGISGGSLFLSGVFAAGAIQAGDLTSSYTSSFNNAGISGSGQAFLDFTGGSALPFFDTNSLANNNGGMNDAFFTTTFDDVNGAASSIGWTVKSVGQISGNLIPEPGSLGLVSLALLGLGFAARRKTK